MKYLYSGSRNLLIFVLAFVVLVAFDVQSKAQNAGNIIDLFGRVIVNDIQRKQENRRQKEYQRQQRLERNSREREARERQRAQDRERQRQVNEERERVIVQVKRTQSALKTLGFYSMGVDGDAGPGTRAAIGKYLTAFGAGNFNFEEYEIQELEKRAAAGFKSAREIAETRAGGFSDAREMRRARDAGFDDFSSYKNALNAGFTSRSEYDSFLASGFNSPSEYEQGKQAGFENRRERDAALAVGFTTRQSHEEFVESGYEDKASFLKAKQVGARFVRVSQDCEKSVASQDWANALASCQTAVALQPENTEIRQLAKTALDGAILLATQLEKNRSDYENQLSQIDSLPTVGASSEQLSKRKLERLKINNEIAANATTLRRIENIRRSVTCSDQIISKSWQLASVSCRAARDALPDEPKWAEFLELATAEAQNETERKIAQDKARRLEAEKEATRLALSAAREKSQKLIADIEKYASDGGKFSDGINLAKALIALRQLGDEATAPEIETRTAELAALVGADEAYQLYFEKLRAADAVATANAAAAAKEQAGINSAFLLAFINANVTHPQVAALLSMRSKIDEALQSGSLERITLENKAAAALIQKEALEEHRLAFMARSPKKSQAEKDATQLIKAENGLAITESNRFLLQGEGDDLLVLYNKSPSAPHVARNLIGEVTFLDGQATACWFHDTRPKELQNRLLMVKLSGFGVSKISGSQTCSATSFAKSDLVLLQRRAFLALPVNRAQLLINSFVTGEFDELLVVTASEFENRIAGSPQTAEEIRREIMADARDGFGLIAVPNSSSVVCGVIDGEAAAHETVLASMSEDLIYLLKGEKSLEIMNLEAAFFRLQKNQCGTIYASAENMQTTLAALERENIDHSVVPVWVTAEQLERARNEIAAKAEASTELAMQQRDRMLESQAVANQKRQGEKLLAEAKAQEKANADRVKQAALRETHRDDAIAAFNELKAIIDRHLSGRSESGTQIRGNFRSMFPESAGWYGEQSGNGWELVESNTVMTDYGRGNWQNRQLPGVFALTTIRLKNRLLGSYNAYCFETGMLLDDEFGLLRFPVEAECQRARKAISDWKTGNNYSSLWVVN